MKCDMGHTPIEWDEKRLFCCPQCLSHAVHNRQREVIEKLQEALRQSQDALKGIMDIFIPKEKDDKIKTGKSYNENEVINLYSVVEHKIKSINDGL